MLKHFGYSFGVTILSLIFMFYFGFIKGGVTEALTVLWLTLILILMEYCISKGKSDSRYIEKVALSWHDLKITTVEQAQNLIKKTLNDIKI